MLGLAVLDRGLHQHMRNLRSEVVQEGLALVLYVAVDEETPFPGAVCILYNLYNWLNDFHCREHI